MIEPTISVIIAAYKVETYLHKCVDSILAQTYKNLELILVDDGSPDSCGAICDDYAKKDDRVKVVHKANGGQSTARNAALDIAQGDYIGFIDGDDWIEPVMYQSLLDVSFKEDADIVQCGWYKVETDGTKECPFSEPFKEVYTSERGLDELIQSQGGHLNTSVCCKLFKRDIAQKYRFSPVRAYEDDEYIFKTVSEATRIVCIDTPYYNYLNREGSTMTATFNLNKIALVTIQSNICELLRKRYPERYPEVQKILCSKQFYILHSLLRHSEIDENGIHAKELFDSLMTSYGSYMQNSQMGRNKLVLWLMKYMPSFVWKKVLDIRFKKT
ncbi:glycosyltransferase [Prevotella sp. P6B1]|uniref:glycosyltransferase family 2 protein n=1 Tax=Prevotella sp. P6B1 TaxID=1410613 RepID=UPI00068EDFFF|nr:glycosyltransferase [Prevotella sp. P6B1]